MTKPQRVFESETWVDRAKRYVIHAPLRYRVRGERHWNDGIVKDISTTGVSFEATHLLETNTQIDIGLILTLEHEGGRGAKVVAQGTIVRSWVSPGVPGTAKMAAAIVHSRLVRIGSESNESGNKAAEE